MGVTKIWTDRVTAIKSLSLQSMFCSGLYNLLMYGLNKTMLSTAIKDNWKPMSNKVHGSNASMIKPHTNRLFTGSLFFFNSTPDSNNDNMMAARMTDVLNPLINAKHHIRRTAIRVWMKFFLPEWNFLRIKWMPKFSKPYIIPRWSPETASMWAVPVLIKSFFIDLSRLLLSPNINAIIKLADVRSGIDFKNRSLQFAAIFWAHESNLNFVFLFKTILDSNNFALWYMCSLRKYEL